MTDSTKFSSKRKYMISAHREWTLDNNLKHMVKVTATGDHNIPAYMLDEHQLIYFNLSEEAVRNLSIDSDFITFEATFNQQQRHIYFPTECVLASVSVDGAGVVDMLPFNFNPAAVIQKGNSSENKKNIDAKSEKPNKKKTHLRIVK